MRICFSEIQFPTSSGSLGSYNSTSSGYTGYISLLLNIYPIGTLSKAHAEQHIPLLVSIACPIPEHIHMCMCNIMDKRYHITGIMSMRYFSNWKIFFWFLQNMCGCVTKHAAKDLDFAGIWGCGYPHRWRYTCVYTPSTTDASSQSFGWTLFER